MDLDEDAILQQFDDGYAADPKPVAAITGSNVAELAKRSATRSGLTGLKSVDGRSNSSLLFSDDDAGSSAKVDGSLNYASLDRNRSDPQHMLFLDDGSDAGSPKPSPPENPRTRRASARPQSKPVSSLTGESARRRSGSSSDLLSDGSHAARHRRQGSTTSLASNRSPSLSNLNKDPVGDTSRRASVAPQTTSHTFSNKSSKSLLESREISSSKPTLSTSQKKAQHGSSTNLVNTSSTSIATISKPGLSNVPSTNRQSGTNPTTTPLRGSKANLAASGGARGSKGSLLTGKSGRSNLADTISGIDAALLDVERNLRTPGRRTSHAGLDDGPGGSQLVALPALPKGAGIVTAADPNATKGPDSGLSAVLQEIRLRRISKDLDQVAPVTAALAERSKDAKLKATRAVVNRLTDPENFPDSYKARLEAVQQHKLHAIRERQLDEEAQLRAQGCHISSQEPTVPLASISAKAQTISDRLYQTSTIASKQGAVDDGLRSARPPPIPIPRTSAVGKRKAGGMDFFNEFSRGATSLKDVPVEHKPSTSEVDPSDSSDKAPIGIFGDHPLKDGKLANVQWASRGNLLVAKKEESL